MKQQLSPPEHCFVLSTKILLTVTLSKQQSSCRLSDVHPLAKLHAIINYQHTKPKKPDASTANVHQADWNKNQRQQNYTRQLANQHKQISAADEEMQLVVRCE